MNNKKIEKITRIMLIFVILQPFFDILSFLNVRGIMSIGISTYVKPLFVMLIAAYVFISYNKNKKNWIIYGILFVIEIIGHMVNLKLILVPNDVILHELRFIINISYMLLLFLIFKTIYDNYENKEELLIKIKKTVFITFLIYILFYVISIVSNTSPLTYEYSDAKKIGYKGWFDSGQIFGHALSCLFPLLYYISLNSNKKYIKIFLPIFLIIPALLLGTKVPYFIMLISLFLYFIISIVIKFLNKKYKLNLFNIIYTLILLIILIASYSYTPVAYNTNVNKDALDDELSTYKMSTIDGTNNSKKLEDELKTIENKNSKESEVKRYILSSKKATAELSKLYESGKVHPANNRTKQFFFSYNLFKFSSLKYKMFGIGYLNQYDFSIESDFFMALFCFGIYGIILILGIPILEFIKQTIFILKNIKKIDLEYYILYMGLGIFFCISIYAGYTYVYTNFSIFLSLLIIMNMLKREETIRLNQTKLNKNKISFLLLHLGYGGIETATINSANALCKKYEVELISFYNLKKNQTNIIDKKIKIKYLYNGEPNRKQFLSALKEFKVKLLIVEGFKALNILYKKKHLIKNEIINSDSFAIISTRYDFSTLLSKYGRKDVIKIAQEHHHHNNNHKYINILKYNYNNIDYLCALTESLKNDYQNFLKKNRHTKIILLTNMIPDMENKRSDLKSKNFISIGRLDIGKRVNELINIFSKVKDKNSKLYIIGDGKEKDNLKELIIENNLEDRVIMTGYLTKSEQEKYLLDSRVFLMASVSEGLPMVLLEAMQYGLPCIAYETYSGVNDIIKNNKNGFVIKNRSKDEYIEKINMLLTDNKLLKKYSNNALRNVKMYSPKSVMKIWNKMLNDKYI